MKPLAKMVSGWKHLTISAKRSICQNYFLKKVPPKNDFKDFVAFILKVSNLTLSSGRYHKTKVLSRQFIVPQKNCCECFFIFGIDVSKGILKVFKEIATKKIEIIFFRIVSTCQWRHSGIFIVNCQCSVTFLWCFYCWLWTSKCLAQAKIIPLNTRRKLNVHETFRRHPGRLLKVLWKFNLRSVSRGMLFYNQKQQTFLSFAVKSRLSAHVICLSQSYF